MLLNVHDQLIENVSALVRNHVFAWSHRMVYSFEEKNSYDDNEMLNKPYFLYKMINKSGNIDLYIELLGDIFVDR